MKRIGTLFVVLLFLIGWGGGLAFADNLKDKLMGISAFETSKQTVVVRFQSEKAMQQFQHKLPGVVKKAFHRFPMMVLELTGKEAAELARNPEVLSVEIDSEFRLYDWPPSGRHEENLLKGRSYRSKDRLDYIGGVTPKHEYEPYGLARMGITEEFHKKGYLGQGVKVGIIDTGVDVKHPDLRVAGGWRFVAGNDNRYSDVLGHGTHVAGIIGARRNGFGVVGVAPEAEIYSLRSFLITGTAGLSSLLDAIQWAIDHKLDILNMSWGSSQSSPAMKDALQLAWDSGLILVAAAGNSGREKDTVGYPAKFDTVIAVSATDENDEIADWSSRGPSVELAAPGVNILSTFTFPMFYEHFYEVLSGTSMAAPQVTGLAALIKSANPGISNQEVRERLHRFARDIGPIGRDNDYGYGIPQPERDPLVMPGSASPIASAGKVYRGVVGEPVRFSCSGSLDPDDNLLTYQWKFGDGASGEGPLPEHIYTIAGNYTASLTVTDQDRNSSQATAEVHIYAGIDQEPVLTATDVGYTREGDKVYHKSILQAGTLSGRTYYGLVQFNSPGVDPIRLLSAELVLTVTNTSPRDEGVITAHLFPPEIVEKWSTLTYTDVDQSAGVLLDSPIVMSHLHETAAKGMEHRFAVPIGAMVGFEEMFNQGSVAFRIALDSEMSSNRLTWANSRLVVRFLEDVEKNNMPPTADAGYDQRVLTGTRVILDGSASSDFEGKALTYQWVQMGGKPFTLSSPNTATIEFTAPSGNDTLIFELTVSDGVFEDTDEVKIFLNNAPAEVHRVVLTPGFENAGYVADDHPTVSMFDKRYFEVGVELREFRGPIGMPKGIAVHAAAIQFDLSAIPPGSQVVSATLELTGAHLRPDAKFFANLKVLSPDIDVAWGKLDYPTLTSAPVKAVLSPKIRHIMLGDGTVNKFKIPSSLVEELRATGNKVTFRIDGPDYDLAAYWPWFIWWSGNEAATAHLGPRLIVDYAALEP